MLDFYFILFYFLLLSKIAMLWKDVR